MSRHSYAVLALVSLLTLGLGITPGLARGPQAEPQTQPQTQPQTRPHDHGHAHGGPVDHSFADVDRWKQVFDDPARDEWQKPEEVIAALRIGAGSVVADLGAGTGYFTMPLARTVAPGGRVLAVDLEPEMVQYLGERATAEGVPGVEPIQADADDAHLPAGVVDRILVVDTYHHIHDRVGYLRRLRESLAPGGQIVIVDFQKRELPVGPPVEHKMSVEDVVGEFRTAGFRLEREENFLPYQYFLVFSPEG